MFSRVISAHSILYLTVIDSQSVNVCSHCILRKTEHSNASMASRGERDWRSFCKEVLAATMRIYETPGQVDQSLLHSVQHERSIVSKLAARKRRWGNITRNHVSGKPTMGSMSQRFLCIFFEICGGAFLILTKEGPLKAKSVGSSSEPIVESRIEWSILNRWNVGKEQVSFAGFSIQ